MSQHQLFKRMPVNQQVAQKLESTTFPAPTRGLVLSENESFMQPGAAIVMDNWVPTMKGAKLRGGCEEWVDLHGEDGGSTGDPYWSNVKLLLGFNGANGSTGTPGMTDESPALHGTPPIGSGGVTGAAQISTARSVFGGSSLLLDGTSAYVGYGDHPDWNLSNQQFTLECRIYATSVAAPHHFIIGQWGTAGNLGWQLWHNGTALQFMCSDDGTTNRTLATTTIAANTWYAVAVDFNGTKYRLYLDGVMVNSSTTLYTFNNSPADLRIGANTGGSPLYFAGNIDELRLTVGTARYASDSGYTVSTAAFPRSAVVALPPPALTDPSRLPVISAFEYASGINHRMFAANATKVYDVTTTSPVLVKSGQTSGNYVASQMANASGDYLMVVNDAGDPPLRFDGATWTTLDASQITGPAGTPVEVGEGLTYVCKYRNRYFFIERNSMNAWYLPLNAIQGALAMIPLSGAATKGGRLLFCATWSIDAGDGIDDKLVFCTDLGELLIFTGSDPASAANWRQEGRYEVSPPMGMNAHIGIGGDMLIATVDGIIPISGAITKDRSELELAAITRNIKPMWRLEVNEKREWPWTMCKWDEYGGLFVTWPGGDPGKRWCAAANLATGAWCRFVGYDATCFIKMRGDMFFGTQDGRIMQADRTGYDDGMPYTATLVGGWEVFQSPGQTITWRQARASFTARANEPFAPQLSATTDYVVILPTPPSAGPDPGVLDLWDEGLWGTALWDASMPSTPAVRNTGWVSIGRTGFSHAPVVQVTVAQQAKPEVDLISIAATFERAGVNV